MFQPGHYGMAMLVYSVIGTVLLARGYRTDAIAGGAVMLLFTMHPDLDSQFGFIPHRQITHTVWFGLVIGFGCATVVLAEGLYRRREFSTMVRPGAWAFSLGTLSILTHLLADTLNPWGVMPFYPVADTLFTFDVVRAGNPAANYGLLAAGILATGLGWHYGNKRATGGTWSHRDSLSELRQLTAALVETGRGR